MSVPEARGTKVTDYWFEQASKSPKQIFRQQAEARQACLAKPLGSLGELEKVAVLLAAMQSTARPAIDPVHITVFAADHGVIDEGISSSHEKLTRERIRIFSRGGAAISILARTQGARFELVNVGARGQLEPMQGVLNRVVRQGTASFVDQVAMQEDECFKAMAIGRDRVDAAWESGCRLWLAGDIGSGATSAAAALAAACLGLKAEQVCGAGSGLDEDVLALKVARVAEALRYHQITSATAPLKVLQSLGGLEIAAQVGGFIRCAQLGLPAMVDGVVGSAAALLAVRIQPAVRQWLIFSHVSAEPAHEPLLAAMEARPLLNLNIRLGEGSGAAIALGVLRQACLLHNDMATVEEMEWDWAE